MSPNPPHAEPLEPRTLFAASVHLDADGVLRVAGTDHADTISIDRTPGEVRALHVHINGKRHIITGEQVNTLRRIVVDAGGGHDHVQLFSSGYRYFYAGDDEPVMPVPRVPTLVLGGDGHDHIEGTINDDTFRGGPGRDTLTGGTGADRLFGGLGDDVLTAGTADFRTPRNFSLADRQSDLLDGGPGQDQGSANDGDRTRSIELPGHPRRLYTLEGQIRTDVMRYDVSGLYLDFEGDDDLGDGVFMNVDAVRPDRTVPIETGAVRVTGYFQHVFGVESNRFLRTFIVTSLTYP
jgi:hypothetical protein